MPALIRASWTVCARPGYETGSLWLKGKKCLLFGEVEVMLKELILHDWDLNATGVQDSRLGWAATATARRAIYPRILMPPNSKIHSMHHLYSSSTNCILPPNIEPALTGLLIDIGRLSVTLCVICCCDLWVVQSYMQLALRTIILSHVCTARFCCHCIILLWTNIYFCNQYRWFCIALLRWCFQTQVIFFKRMSFSSSKDGISFSRNFTMLPSHLIKASAHKRRASEGVTTKFNCRTMENIHNLECKKLCV